MHILKAVVVWPWKLFMGKGIPTQKGEGGMTPRIISSRFVVVGRTMRAYLRFNDGRTGYGEKVCDFGGLCAPDAADERTAEQRALQNALGKSIPGLKRQIVSCRFEVTGKTVRAYIYLDDGRMFRGEKLSDFLGLSDIDEADANTAFERAVKQAV